MRYSQQQMNLDGRVDANINDVFPQGTEVALGIGADATTTATKPSALDSLVAGLKSTTSIVKNVGDVVDVLKPATKTTPPVNTAAIVSNQTSTQTGSNTNTSSKFPTYGYVLIGIGAILVSATIVLMARK